MSDAQLAGSPNERPDPNAFLTEKRSRLVPQNETVFNDDGIAYYMSPTVILQANGRYPAVTEGGPSYAIGVQSDKKSACAMGGSSVLAGMLCAGLTGVAVAGAVCVVVLLAMRIRDKRLRRRQEAYDRQAAVITDTQHLSKVMVTESKQPSHPPCGCSRMLRNEPNDSCVRCGGRRRRRQERVYAGGNSFSSTAASSDGSEGSAIVVDVHPNMVQLRANGETRDLWRR